MLGLAFVEPSTNCPNRKRDETTANNAGRSARPRPVPGPGPGERSENRQRRMNTHTRPPHPQCVSSTWPDAAHRRVRSMLGPSLFGPTLDSRDVPGTSPGHPVIPPRPFNPARSTAPINGRASVLSLISAQEPLGVPTTRPDCRTGLVCIHLHRPKMSLAVVVNRHALSTLRGDVKSASDAGTSRSSTPRPPFSRRRLYSSVAENGCSHLPDKSQHALSGTSADLGTMGSFCCSLVWIPPAHKRVLGRV